MVCQDPSLLSCFWSINSFFFLYFVGAPQTPTSNDGEISLFPVFYLLDMNTWQTFHRDGIKKIMTIFNLEYKETSFILGFHLLFCTFRYLFYCLEKKVLLGNIENNFL